MTLALSFLGIATLVELLLYVPPLWHVRRVAAAPVIIAIATISGLLLVASFSLGSCLIALVSFYRVFNLLRMVEGRMHEHYLRQVALRTSSSLMALQLVVLLGWALSNLFGTDGHAGWLLLAGLQLAAVIVILLTTKRHLRTTLPKKLTEHFSDQQLPSISVCVPARNETASLEDCLRLLVASDYPKLEILVLDDQSHDRTPEIIRSFAHDGVRFIKGTPPPESWLAKNWAYQQLYEAANGELLIFCGVDMRFERSAIRTLITASLSQHKSMISVLPANQPPEGLGEQRAFLLQPLRYAWELCLPRRFFRRPPVLSSCWVATRDMIERAGSFGAVATNITPESHFAKAAIADDGYSFVQAQSELTITSIKTLRDQWATAVRTRYPQLHKRPELVLVVSVLEMVGTVLPLLVGVIALLHTAWLLAILSLLGFVIANGTYAAVVTTTYHRFLWRSLVALSFASLLDVYIRHESMWRYEFGSVTWKGRDVAFPVMRVIAHLPEIPAAKG